MATPSEVILWHYDASPFTQKALRMLGLKGLAWRSVQTPMLPPKDDLVALTGGYRGTPVLQVGADVYIDTQRIALALEALHPAPTLFPGADRGLALALDRWSLQFFRAGLKLAIGALSADWPEAFRADRQQLFPDIDFARIGDDVPQARAQLRAHAGLIDAQLADGRRFLAGDAPGLADIQAFSVPWFTRAAIPGVNDLFAAFAHLPAWEARVAALGEGVRTEITAEEALAVARAARPIPPAGVDSADAQGLRSGDRVEVRPDDTERGALVGEVVSATWNGIAVRREHSRTGEVVVHLPRIGYRITPMPG